MLSSGLITQAVSATRHRWPDVPDQGMITFVDAGKVRRKRDPGRCFIKAGFIRDGFTEGGLVALLLTPSAMPPEESPMWPGDSLFSEMRLAGAAP